ncbi:MAG: GNAT family N-acetyltransferase [Bacteroidota bacterium]
MIIREPNPNDTPAIIQLLQLSLGESLLKKTADIWEYKHVKNPFGKSYVLLGEEDGVLVGVRALMQWRWQLGDEVWTSYRAVDTATHPNHQGIGIFKKLTLSALDDVQKKGDCFVFNTPNDQSRPGYLKMGWKEVGKINVAVVFTFFYFFRLLFKAQTNEKADDGKLDQLCELHNADLKNKNIIFTPKSTSYLKWRYEENLLQKYHVISKPNFYIAMYIKRHRFFSELRVVETIGSFKKENHSQICSSIVQYAFKNNCWLITLEEKNVFKLRIYGAFGPKLTFKSLTSNTTFIKSALNLKKWKYSIGDLELF